MQEMVILLISRTPFPMTPLAPPWRYVMQSSLWRLIADVT
jgi:hypothetical protein